MIKAIIVTNDYTTNYDVVEVLKSPVSKVNQLAHIRKSDGEEVYSGGILIEDNEITKKVLDTLTPKEQWDWLSGIKKEILVW